jgi:hypothetical protein
MAEPPPVRLVSRQELYQLFNDGEYWERAQRGELHQQLRRDRHPASPAAPVPYCTRSQTIKYLDSTGAEVALVHQYLRPDGSLGASGRPEPKRLFVDGVLWVCDPAQAGRRG